MTASAKWKGVEKSTVSPINQRKIFCDIFEAS